MGWVSPRTFTVGEIITKTILDTHVRDNLKYLKGESGVPTIESGLIIDNTGGDEYLQIPSLTTTERDALTPVNGMVIYNETTTEFNKYENGFWVDLADNTDHGGLDGLGDDDHTQYLKENLLTTQGDIPYATAASTWERLPKGTAGQQFRMNAGATAPEWSAGVLVSKLITVTRDLGTASGNISYTGAGSTPVALIAVGGGSIHGSGACDSALTEQGNWSDTSGAGGAAGFIRIDGGGGATQIATVASLDADGFTLTWTKAGGGSGAYTVYVLCLA